MLYSVKSTPRVYTTQGPARALECVQDYAVKTAAARYGVPSGQVKLSAVPAWKKQFRRAFTALENRAHAWHGVVSGGSDRRRSDVTVNNILRSGHVAPAHLRPNVMTGEVSEWKKAPHSGAYFSTDGPTRDYWRGGAGGVGIPRASISGEIVYYQPAGYQHELLSHGAVPLPPKAFAVPPNMSTVEELNEFRRLTQQLRLRPLHPTALQYAGMVAGPGASTKSPGAFERLQSGLLSGMKEDKKQYARELRHFSRYGGSAPLKPAPSALSGP